MAFTTATRPGIPVPPAWFTTTDAAAIPEEIPYFKMVQKSGKRLLIQGKLTLEDLALLRKNLSPRGLYLQIVVENPEEIPRLREFYEPWI